MRTGRPKRPMFERFAEKLQLNQESGCWEWIGCKFPAGYGAFVIRNELTRPAHRVSYEWFIGPIPEGHDIHHLCKNRACVCPTHLKAVTRSLHGVEHRMNQNVCRHGHKLTPENIITFYTPSGKRRWRCRQCNCEQMKARLLEYRKKVPRKPHASSAKTHCKRGHELAGDNIRITSHGSRQCIACYEMLKAKYRAAKPPKQPKQPKTHCLRGHLLSPENVSVHRGSRHCLECMKIRVRLHRQKKQT